MYHKLKLIILSGFSGAGKTTLATRILPSLDITPIKTYSTRNPRNGADDYHFVTLEEFTRLKEQGFFLETNEFGENMYGSPKKDILTPKESGVPLLILDPNGHKKIIDSGLFKKEEVLSIFIAATAEDLAARLKHRASEDTASIIQRLSLARRESHHMKNFDVVIVNQDLDMATKKLLRVIEGDRISDWFDVDKFQEENRVISGRLTAEYLLS